MTPQVLLLTQCGIGSFSVPLEISASRGASGLTSCKPNLASFRGLRVVKPLQQTPSAPIHTHHLFRYAVRRTEGATCFTDVENTQTSQGVEVSHFLAPQEVSVSQKLVQPLSASLRYATCVSLLAASIGAGYVVGGKVAPAGQLAVAVMLGVAGAAAALAVNNAVKQVAAVELRNRVARGGDPLAIQKEEVDEIAKRYGVDPRNGPFNKELKDIYARFLQSVIPQGDAPLRGHEADALLRFKSALGLEEPEAAAAHIEVGRRILRQRLNVVDKDMQAHVRKTFQKLVYVSRLVFGDAHTSLLPWKRILKVSKSQEGRMLSTNVARVLVAATGALYWCFSSQANSLLAGFWCSFRNNPVSRFESFEPMVAVASFLVWSVLFHVLDLHWPSLAKYRVGLSHSMRAWKVEGYLRKEILNYLGPLLVFDFLVPRRAAKLMAAGVPTVERVFLELWLCILVYDALFFAAHLALHRVRFLQPQHERHHMSGSATRACDATRVSALEQFLNVGAAIIAVNVTSAHPVTRLLFNIVLTYMIVEVHAGYNFPWMLHNVIPWGVLGGSPRHEYHHRVGTRFYQQVFTYLDNLLDWWQGREGWRTQHC